MFNDDYTYYTYDSKDNVTVLATLKKDFKGETPNIYDSSLTCFNTLSYTYDSKGRIKGTGFSVSGPISIASVSVSTHSKLIKIKSYI